MPSYLEVTAMTVAQAPTSGTTTSRISDIWVYVDDELLGSWEVPARIPVLRKGATNIQISPAVKRNGAYDDRVRYPFYEWWSGSVDLVPEGITRIQPQTSYTSFTSFWVEAFEDAGFLLNPTQNSNVDFVRFNSQEHPDIVQPGSSTVAGFGLPDANSYMRLVTDQNFSATGGPFFLEMDYSTNVVLTVGIMYAAGGQGRTEPYVYLVPTAQAGSEVPVWNKVYIDLSPVFNLAIQQRDIYLEAFGPASGTGRVYLDNIKIVRTSQ